MLNQPPDAGNRAALQSILQDYTNDTHPTTWNPNLHRGGRRGAGEDLEAAGAAGRPGCAERAVCEDIDEVRGGGGRDNVVGAAGAAGLRETGRARGRRGARRRRQGRRGRGAVGAAGRPRRRGMTSRGGCTDRAARRPRCVAARARKKAAGEEGGGARGRVCWAI